jgi:hypothetical protein
VKRSLEWANVAANADGLVVLTFLCDCAVVTELVTEMVADDLPPAVTQELAYTCDGCQTTHWFTFTTVGVP